MTIENRISLAAEGDVPEEDFGSLVPNVDVLEVNTLQRHVGALVQKVFHCLEDFLYPEMENRIAHLDSTLAILQDIEEGLAPDSLHEVENVIWIRKGVVTEIVGVIF